MKITTLILSTLLTMNSVLAQTKTEKRTDRTDNTIIIVVGKCSVNLVHDPLKGKEVYQYTLPVTSCEEYKTYTAEVTGKSWNKKYTPVPGTETYEYRLAQNPEIRSMQTGDLMGSMEASSQCGEKRNLLEQLAKAKAGQAKCKL